jgi:hypothetical protein
MGCGPPPPPALDLRDRHSQPHTEPPCSPHPIRPYRATFPSGAGEGDVRPAPRQERCVHAVAACWGRWREAPDGVWPAAATLTGLRDRHCKPSSDQACFPHPIRPSATFPRGGKDAPLPPGEGSRRRASGGRPSFDGFGGRVRVSWRELISFALTADLDPADGGGALAEGRRLVGSWAARRSAPQAI